jgi:hypothetical protein
LSSEAYSTLFLDLISSPGSGAEFFSALMPKNMDKIAEKVRTNLAAGAQDDGTPAWIRENRAPTDAEMKNMTKAQMAEAFRRRLNGTN